MLSLVKKSKRVLNGIGSNGINSNSNIAIIIIMMIGCYSTENVGCVQLNSYSYRFEIVYIFAIRQMFPIYSFYWMRGIWLQYCSGNRWNVKKPFVASCKWSNHYWSIKFSSQFHIVFLRYKRSDCHFATLHSPSDAIATIFNKK